MSSNHGQHHLNELLQKHNLKVTGPRLSVLAVLTARQAALSQPDLENILKQEADRVTLYRVLKTFTETGIIHKVFNAHGTATYALCSSRCDEHQHHDEHLHFNCTVCNRVYCLDEMHFPEIKLPAGFKTEFMTVTASGVCSQCSKSESV